MTEYSRLLIVGPDSSERLTDGIIEKAREFGIGIVLSDEKGITPISPEIPSEKIEELNKMLPAGISANKGNGILHKLNKRKQAVMTASARLNEKQNF